MSFLTCFWLFPQKEHFSRSPPSPIRATGGHPPVVELCAVERSSVSSNLPDGTPCRPRSGSGHEDGGVAGQAQPATAGVPLRDASTASIRPYSTAPSAVRI